jgi:hypothetical protein
MSDYLTEQQGWDAIAEAVRDYGYALTAIANRLPMGSVARCSAEVEGQVASARMADARTA